MARKVIEIVQDDLTGQEIAGNSFFMRISVDVLDSDMKPVKGRSASSDYEVGNFTLAQIVEFVGGSQDFGQMLSNFRKVVKVAATSANESDANLIRTWAKSQGIEVNERGRVPADIEAKYRAAHSVNADPMPKTEAAAAGILPHQPTPETPKPETPETPKPENSHKR